MPRKLTESKRYARMIAAWKPEPGDRKPRSDPTTEGLYCRPTPAGKKTLCVVSKVTGTRKQIWKKLLDYVDESSLEEARRQAPAVVERIKFGLPVDTIEPNSDPTVFTLKDAVAQFMEFHDKGRRRTTGERQRIFDHYLLPELGARGFASIRRSEYVALIDKIAAGELIVDGKKLGGPRQAQMVFASTRTMCGWHAIRNDGYVSPFIAGMAWVSPHERQRDRILDDDEIAKLWRVTALGGAYYGLIRFLLLTASRLTKAAEIQWGDIKDGIWHVRPDDELASREKGTCRELPLSDLAIATVKSQPRIDGNDHIFAGRGAGPYRGFPAAKKRLNAKLEFEKSFVVHDLRRSARSLLSRAGVAPHVAEMAMGHKLTGIVAVYDRYTYATELKQAFAALADEVARIVGADVQPLEAGE